MQRRKIGTIFILLILALSGIGISYSGFMDSITIYGTVDTASVTIDVVDYSGTEVWKVWMDEGVPPVPYDDEVYIWHGFKDNQPSMSDVLSVTGADHAELVATAWAQPGSTHGTIDYDVDMIWDNIFPCFDFTADVIIKYIGSIPAKLQWPDIAWFEGEEYFRDYITFEVYRYILDNGEWIKGKKIDVWPYQVHQGYYIGFETIIHLEQLNNLQDKHGEFSFNIEVIQWNNQCEDGNDNIPPIADADGPYSGKLGDTITLDGSGSYDPDGDIVLYEWDFDDDGTYDWSSMTTGLADHIYLDEGIYNTMLRVTDDKGDSGTDSTIVTINEPQATVSLIPSKDVVEVGEDFTVDIFIDPELEVGGWEIYELVFSSGLIMVNDVVPGSFWTSFFDPGVIDNIAGTITGIQTWSMGPYPDMSHVACTLFCTAMDSDSCTFDITDMDIADSDGNLLTNILFKSEIIEIIT